MEYLMMIKGWKKTAIWIMANALILGVSFYAWIAALLPKMIPDFVDSWCMSGYRRIGFKCIKAEYPNNLLGLFQHFWDSHFFIPPIVWRCS